ncbi:hypothetical protein [Mesorhizobium sp. M0047]|uniref:hypothetical protein n=1 Tax=Mesorhizobium sp. M0047 TaxID=2956859 RepID=UPI0033390198
MSAAGACPAPSQRSSGFGDFAAHGAFSFDRRRRRFAHENGYQKVPAGYLRVQTETVERFPMALIQASAGAGPQNVRRLR